MVSQGKELVALASASDPAALGNSSAPGLLASPVLLSPGALEAVAHLRALPFKKRHGWAEPSRPRGDNGENEQAEPSNVVVDDDDDGDSATAADLTMLQHDAIPERLQHDEHTLRFKWRSVCELSPLQQPDASARPGTFKWKTIDVQQGPGGRPAPPTLGNSILAQPPLKPPQEPSPAPFASGLMMPPPAPPGMAPGMARAVQLPMLPQVQPAMQPSEPKARPKLGSAKGTPNMELAVGGIILGPILAPSPLQFQWVHVNMAPKMAPAVTAQDEADRPDAQRGAASTISSVISSEPPAKKPRKSCKELCELRGAQEASPMELLPQPLIEPLIGLEAQGQVVPLAVVMRLKGSRLLDLPAPTSQAQLRREERMCRELAFCANV
eukprot:jgi/Chrpa1/9727/Chrysochromulina_OHIO_Genome00016962-RA